MLTYQFKNMKKTLFLLVCGLTLIQNAFAVDLKTAKAGDVIEVQVKEIHPTQAAIGYREVDYKINRFMHDKEKMFADYCETAGAKDVSHFDAQSTLLHPESFTCKEAYGTEKHPMKTVVIAPDNSLYLTDGHHTLSVYDAISGDKVPVYVLISDDFRKLPDMNTFWAAMEKRNLVLLRNNDQVLTPQELPSHIGKKSMANDEFRSIMYYLKDIGFKKPKNAPPFFEFYWGSWIKSHMNVTQYNLNDKDNYASLLKATAMQMISADKNSVIATIDGKAYTAKDMGALSSFNNDKFEHLFSAKGKITYAFEQ